MTTEVLESPEVLESEIPLPPLDLPAEDGIPLESNWHRMAMNLLIDAIHAHWHDREDYFVGGNMFIYFSMQQVRNRDYRGPDFFIVKDVDGSYDRPSWILWQEGGRYPNLIVELASPSTVETDLGTKKQLYEQIFRTPEYFCYDPATHHLLGWRLTSGSYQALKPNDSGWLWSEELQLWVGLWEGAFQRTIATWPRFFTPEGALVPTLTEAEAQRAQAEAQRAEAEAQRAQFESERAEAEAQRAQAEAQRAEAAEAEIARLRARLAALGVDPEQDNAT